MGEVDWGALKVRSPSGWNSPRLARTSNHLLRLMVEIRT